MTGRLKGREPVAAFELLGLVCAVAAGTALVFWALRSCLFGFDFTDEGFDLQWIAHPSDYRVSITEFGYFYHPLYRLLRGNIGLLRQVNVLITLGLGNILCLLVLREISSRQDSTRSWLCPRSICLGFVLSTSALAFLDPWLPTPNYDSLALQAILTAASGMLLAERVISRAGIAGWLLIGCSGWLSFMAKPTTAAALAIVVGFYLVASGKSNFRMMILSLTTTVALCVISAWAIDGSIASFAMRIVTGVEDAGRLQARHTLREALRFDNFFLGDREKELLWGSTSLVFIATLAAISENKALRIFSAVIVIAFSGACILVALGLTIPAISPTPFQGLQYWAVPFGSILATLACSQGNVRRLPGFQSAVLAICFSTLPIVYAFGTSVNYWLSAAHASIFWVLAGVAVLTTGKSEVICWRAILPIAVAAEVCAAALILLSTEHPYREIHPLRENHEQMRFTGTNSKLWVSHEFASYVSNLNALARSGGFGAGDSIIDLTGHYPGALYAVGAKSLGRPWMIGGYAGSEILAEATLDRVPRTTILKSWILTEQSGPRSISKNILNRYGLDLDKDYAEVGSLLTPPGDYPGVYTQRLLKPAH